MIPFINLGRQPLPNEASPQDPSTLPNIPTTMTHVSPTPAHIPLRPTLTHITPVISICPLHKYNYDCTELCPTSTTEVLRTPKYFSCPQSFGINASPLLIPTLNDVPPTDFSTNLLPTKEDNLGNRNINTKEAEVKVESVESVDDSESNESLKNSELSLERGRMTKRKRNLSTRSVSSSGYFSNETRSESSYSNLPLQPNSGPCYGHGSSPSDRSREPSVEHGSMPSLQSNLNGCRDPFKDRYPIIGIEQNNLLPFQSSLNCFYGYHGYSSDRSTLPGIEQNHLFQLPIQSNLYLRSNLNGYRDKSLDKSNVGIEQNRLLAFPFQSNMSFFGYRDPSLDRFTTSSTEQTIGAGTEETTVTGIEQMSLHPVSPNVEIKSPRKKKERLYDPKQGIWHPLFSTNPYKNNENREPSASIDNDGQENETSDNSNQQIQMHQCAQCLRSFNRKSNLERHMLLHTGERPFACHICHSTFTQVANLNYHLRIHNGSYPYCCVLCNKNFRSTSHAQRHILNQHSSEKPYFCPICKKNFTTWDQGKRHIKNVHNSDQKIQRVKKVKDENKSMSEYIIKVS